MLIRSFPGHSYVRSIRRTHPSMSPPPIRWPHRESTAPGDRTYTRGPSHCSGLGDRGRRRGGNTHDMKPLTVRDGRNALEILRGFGIHAESAAPIASHFTVPRNRYGSWPRFSRIGNTPFSRPSNPMTHRCRGPRQSWRLAAGGGSGKPMPPAGPAGSVFLFADGRRGGGGPGSRTCPRCR